MNSRRKNGQFERNHIAWKVVDDIAYCYVNGTMQFYVDAEDMDRFNGRPISKMADGYSGTRDDGKVVLVHRFIIEAPDGSLVDHINRNKKDNRKCNLRLANKGINAFNSGVHKNNKSGCPGVCFRKDTKRWSAEIKVNNVKHNLGCFSTKDEAIEARRSAEVFYGVSQQ